MQERQRINQGLVGISALVPREWLDKKKKTGFSWRQLIMRGFNSVLERAEIEAEMNHFFERAVKLNEQNTAMRSRMWALEEEIKKLKGEEVKP